VTRAGALLAAALLAALLLSGCGACPPRWLEHPPEEREALFATGSCGEVMVDADALQVALVRAARRIADRLGLDVEPRLSVVHADGRLFVEALTPDGPTGALDGLQLVDSAECDDVTHVLVRLPRGPNAPHAPRAPRAP
jgi:hypothetical protein